MGKAPFDRITGYLLNPRPPDVNGTAAMAFGSAARFVLSFLRTKFIWFPFHAGTYVLANTGTLYWLWCPFLIAWLCKVTITKCGGIKGYRTALPFFLGLVFGDQIVSSLWALAGSILRIKMYRCFPCQTPNGAPASGQPPPPLTRRIAQAGLRARGLFCLRCCLTCH